MYLFEPLRHQLPAVIRGMIRGNKLPARSTSGLAEGFKQVNITILHKSLADDFEKFCNANSGPLPLLYRSEPGEWKCPPLSADSDIRTDCLQYRKYEHGIFTGTPENLMEYSEELRDMVTFYLGCSFSFEKALQTAGIPIRNIEQGCNVSMYKTAVPCFGVGSFQCNLVVSMRPVPVDLLNAVTQISQPMKEVHGAPVHIGSPGMLGIREVSEPDFGDPVEAQLEDVPVFWACGVTALGAVQSCKSPLAFTHAPGCMLITDQKSKGASTGFPVCPSQIPEVYCISQNPVHYSIVSAGAVEKIRALEELIQSDPGDRGIKHLFLKDELLKASLSISHAKSVLITTGFPTHFNYNPPEETDGPPGAFAMASMLQALKKEVAIVTDQRALEMYKMVMQEAVEQGVLETPVPLFSFHDDGMESSLKFLCHNGNPQTPRRFEQLVAIERSGMAADGNYYNMRKVNIKHLVDPIDKLFLTAGTIPGISTTGIGDGGNELGMGKVKEAVKKHIQNGDLIACDVEADFAVTAGVSNWGGYAVACTLYILNNCEIHERYLRKAVGFPCCSEKESWVSVLPSITKEEKLLQILVNHGIRSGRTGNLEMEVDGLPFYNFHSTMIAQLREVTLGQL
uniref:D-glutamate cyclase, mitochondrial n=1 Tax=Latimeria chalumnae TaxID=7897 RepID=H3APZ8_LATCH